VFHYLYRTENLINGKFYIGIHSGLKNPEDDGYLGSGTKFLKAVKKYGKSNFRKIVLYTFKSRQEAKMKERELVNEEMVADRRCYNIAIGGDGGSKHTEEAKRKIGDASKGKPNLWMATEDGKKSRLKTSETMKEQYAVGRVHHYSGKARSEEDRKKISASLVGNIPWNKGVTLTPEHRYKISEVQRGKHDRIELELVKVGWNYKVFKDWVLDLHRSGLGPIKIWRQLPPGCKISDRPIKTIIKEYQCQTS
jgi:group I intron endonuclease